jgi:hypothetical protein
MTERATPARMDTAPTTSPPAELLLLVLVVIAGELDEMTEGDTIEEGLLLSPVLEGVTEEDTLVVFVGTVVLLLPVTERYAGAGVAVDGSVSAPNPQGICSPVGWVVFAGGTVAPDELAMANRPVHERFEEAAEVNW